MSDLKKRNVNTIDESISELARCIGHSEARLLYDEFNALYRLKHGCFSENGEDYFTYLDKKERALQLYVRLYSAKVYKEREEKCLNGGMNNG